MTPQEILLWAHVQDPGGRWETRTTSEFPGLDKASLTSWMVYVREILSRIKVIQIYKFQSKIKVIQTPPTAPTPTVLSSGAPSFRVARSPEPGFAGWPGIRQRCTAPRKAQDLATHGHMWTPKSTVNSWQKTSELLSFSGQVGCCQDPQNMAKRNAWLSRCEHNTDKYCLRAWDIPDAAGDWFIPTRSRP
jgi:hypothetical protein